MDKCIHYISLYVDCISSEKALPSCGVHRENCMEYLDHYKECIESEYRIKILTTINNKRSINPDLNFDYVSLLFDF